MQGRFADVKVEIGIVAMDLEVVFVGAVLGPRIERGRIDRQLPPRIEYLDRAEVLGGGGVIEQDQVQHRPADMLELGHQHVVGYRAQRQVVELDIAADIGFDAGGDIFQHLPCELFLAAAHVQQYGRANRGKADDGCDRRGDQELDRQSPAPPDCMFPPLEQHSLLPEPLQMRRESLRRP